MASDQDTIEIRKITQEEAEQCANEKIQHIGTIQPHGFLLLVDKASGVIVQHSGNVLPLLNNHLDIPIAPDTPILDTPISAWLDIEEERLSEELVSSGMQVIEFNTGGIISSEYWECMGANVDEYILLEFFPAAKRVDSAQLINSLDRMVTRIRASSSMEELFKNMTNQFQKLTGYDRVMLYKFHPDWSGEVLSESVSEGTEKKFQGLRFPADDIPKQARELYKNSALRIMADVDADPVPLVPQILPSGKPLNQSLSILRSISSMHVTYLKNMGVKASMSIALMSRGELWGLMALHHYSPRVPPQHLVSEMKASCELFAEIVISHLNPAMDLQRIQKAVESKQSIDDVFQRLKSSSKSTSGMQEAINAIQAIIDKQYVGYCLNGQCYIAGGNGDWQQDEALSAQLSTLMEATENGCFESNKLLDAASPICLSEDLRVAGILVKKGRSVPGLLVFFGALEQEKEISWGGKPGSVNIIIKNGERRLEPRSSFALWQQKVTGHSRAWSDEDKELIDKLLGSTEDFILFSQNEEVREKLHESSYNDALTGLPNRRYLEEFINDLALHPEREPLITTFFIDLDNFKRINDFIGHHAGDHLLTETAKRIQECVRPDDLVSRLGGDEFVVVISHTGGDSQTHRNTAERIAEKIIASVGHPVFEDEQPMITTPSIGALTCNPCLVSYGDILQRTDIAMYHAKNMGKNQVHFFSSEDQKRVHKEGELEAELRKCLDNKELKVFYQPQIDAEKRVIGAEALARWIHPELGFVSHEVFIDLAEKHNLINELGKQVFDITCGQLAQWKAQGLAEHLETVSVNISPTSLLSNGFVKQVGEAIKHHGLETKDIQLEITESLFMQNFEEALEVIGELRTMGFRVSLDDFGTGYSSLSYLWKLPIDEVKIDRSFITNMADDDDSLNMVEGIINLCKKMNLSIVAEGVEEKIQVKLLRAFGCDIYQGYYYGKPVDAEAFSFTVEQ